MHREMLLGAKWMPHGQRMLSRPRMQASSKLRVKKKRKKKRKQGVSKNHFFFIFSEVQIEDKAVQASD